MPSAGLVGALCWSLANRIGGTLATMTVFGFLVVASAAMFHRSRKTPISPDNVNAEWQGSLAPAEPQPDRAVAVSAV